MMKGNPKSKAPSSGEIPSIKAPNGSVRYDSVVEEALEMHDGSNDGEPRHPFDLEERTAVFGENVIRFCRKIPGNATNNRLISQLVGCGTSIGANYCEANESVSGKDFKCIVSRCAKEAKEARYFLRMIVASEPAFAEEARKLYLEANELLLIFSSMRRK